MEADRVVDETTRPSRQTRQRRAAARRARRFRLGGLGFLVVAALVTVAVFAVRSPAEETSASVTKGPLLLRDEFSGSTLDSEHWSPCYWWATDGCTNLSNNELEWYVPEQVTVSQGVLRLEARSQQVVGINGKTFDYVSGLISNQSPDRNHFSFTFGYVEARVRIPEGQGLWPALWMLPTTRQSLPEVDIFEFVGERPNVVEMHTHWLEDGEERQRGKRFRGPNFAAGWHTFGLEWKPDSLTWFVDGVPRWVITDVEQIPQEPMYLVANLAVGGDFTERPNAETKFPAALEVEYVKVWGAPPRGSG
jgi:beta-glucanase (GH16 family)